jgi:hypothetical protein
MRKFLLTTGLCLAAMLAGNSVFGQNIPNRGFENWETALGVESPEDWSTSDQLYSLLGFSGKTVLKDSFAHTGKFGMRVTSDKFTFLGTETILPGFAATKFAIATKPAYLIGFYRGTLNPDDTAMIVAGFTNTDTANNTTDTVGGGFWMVPAGKEPEYKFFVIPITYKQGSVDSANIMVLVNGKKADTMGYVAVDVMALSDNAVGISEFAHALSGLIYPNPASHNVTLKIMSTRSGEAEIGLKDIAGRSIMNIFSGNINEGANTFNFDVNGLNAGIYFCTITIDGQSSTQRLIISR